MIKQDFYYWRLLATGLSFGFFGLGALLIGCLAFPFVGFSSRQQSIRQRRGRKLNHCAFRLFVWQMKAFGVLSYEVSDDIKRALNRPGQLIIANHPTLIDVVFLMSFIEQVNCIVRYDLFNNIFTRGPIRNANYVPNINGEQLVAACCECLRHGDSLIIFPEGTRTPVDVAVPKLQRGAAAIAVRAKVKPLPIIIKCQPNTLSKGEKWYHIPYKKPHWTFILGDAIELPEVAGLPKAARALNSTIQQHFFIKE